MKIGLPNIFGLKIGLVFGLIENYFQTKNAFFILNNGLVMLKTVNYMKLKGLT